MSRRDRKSPPSRTRRSTTGRMPRRRRRLEADEALATGQDWTSPDAIASALRYFVGRVELNNATGLPSRLGFTSALRGEGVTTLCVVLSEVIARDSERTVCLVDLNWYSTGGHEDGAGLTGVLNGDIDLNSAVSRTSVDRLSYVASGAASDAQAHSFVRSSKLAVVLDELAARFDHLVLDLPAVSGTSDTLALARLCDSVALVVRHGVTTEHQIQTALDELRGAVVLGVLLNRTTSKIPRPLRALAEVR